VDFEERLAGDFVAIHWKSGRPEPVIVDLSAQRDVLWLQLVLPQHLPEVSMQPILTRQEYSVDGLISPGSGVFAVRSKEPSDQLRLPLFSGGLFRWYRQMGREGRGLHHLGTAIAGNGASLLQEATHQFLLSR
jgi:hypothetical protein